MSEPARVLVHTLDTADVLHGAGLDAWSAPLDASERARAERFAQIADRCDYVAAHGLLRRVLADVLDVSAGELAFTVDEPRGKPRLAWPPDTGIDFSLTHTRGLVAVAVATKTDGPSVGIDAENLGRSIDDELAAVYCSSRELAALRDRGADMRSALWVMKEALVKACGRGLEMDLRGVELDLNAVEIDVASPQVSHVPPRMGEPWQWRVHWWHPDAAHVAALAWRQDPERELSVEYIHERL